MFTDVQHINMGLSKIASSRIRSISPASTPLEQYMAVNYPIIKLAEMAKRRWVFATVTDYKLTQISSTETNGKKYKYTKPIDALRVLRSKRSEWVQRGSYIYSNHDNLCVDYIRNAPESDWDVLFSEVVACAVAYKTTEYITQSSSKKADVKSDFSDALKDAAKANAFTIGPEDLEQGDEYDQDSWIAGHNA